MLWLLLPLGVFVVLFTRWPERWPDGDFYGGLEHGWGEERPFDIAPPAKHAAQVLLMRRICRGQDGVHLGYCIDDAAKALRPRVRRIVDDQRARVGLVLEGERVIKPAAAHLPMSSNSSISLYSPGSETRAVGALRPEAATAIIDDTIAFPQPAGECDHRRSSSWCIPMGIAHGVNPSF